MAQAVRVLGRSHVMTWLPQGAHDLAELLQHVQLTTGVRHERRDHVQRVALAGAVRHPPLLGLVEAAEAPAHLRAVRGAVVVRLVAGRQLLVGRRRRERVPQPRHVAAAIRPLAQTATLAPAVGGGAAAAAGHRVGARHRQPLERAGGARGRAAAAAGGRVARHERRAARRRRIRRRADGGAGEQTRVGGGAGRRATGRRPAASGAAAGIPRTTADAAGASRAATGAAAPSPGRPLTAVDARRLRRQGRATRLAFAEEFLAGALRAQESRQP